MTVQDPRLKAAMAEVQNVLDKWDVMAIVVIADGLGHAEFRVCIDRPTWSTFRWLPGEGRLHYKGYMKTKPVETQRSTNALVCMTETTGTIAYQLIQLEKKVTDVMNTEKEEGKMEFRGPDKEDQ